MSAQLGEGLARLRVGGTPLSRTARIQKIASTDTPPRPNGETRDCRITAARYCNSARTPLALGPPNPKEFDSARRTGRSFAAWGVRSMSAQLGEGLSRLRVGGTTLSRIARIEKIASTAPAAPSRWPIADLVDDIDTFFTASPNNRRTAPTSISSPSGVEVPCALM